MNEQYLPDHIEKEWGFLDRIFSCDSVHVDRLSIDLGGLSSGGNFHRHRHKFNKFYVESGQLVIWAESFNNKYKYILGDECKSREVTIYPNNLHRFEALTNCIVWEIYWTICNKEDIIRYSFNEKQGD